MATRVRIEAGGPNQWTIVAPDVRIPFRGTRALAERAATVIAKIMSTAFFDVELDLGKKVASKRRRLIPHGPTVGGSSWTSARRSK